MRLIFSVAPRYTPGSPAGVDEATAARVAEQERASHARILQGYHGEEERRRAEQDGLRGIVLVMSSRGGRWEVEDALTGERYRETTLINVGTERFWLYCGHMHDDLRAGPYRRGSIRPTDRLIMREGDVIGQDANPRQTAVMVLAEPAPVLWTHTTRSSR